ncbi:hypothetical protein P9E05_02075 [Bacillus mojavensis]|uniref:hypothetical protein n=1 Tax=Bacillus mojavensis TaxID=72360 RepID=UPI002DB90F0B|nr:hypothetical protein [Bacillus mojavensis]MEC1690313.1 hypothetical protein [Bacillus mojavensis]
MDGGGRSVKRERRTTDGRLTVKFECVEAGYDENGRGPGDGQAEGESQDRRADRGKLAQDICDETIGCRPKTAHRSQGGYGCGQTGT